MKLAALQMRAVPGDPAANLDRIETAMREAAAQGAELLVAPELAVTAYGAGEVITALAEPVDGAMAKRLSRAALETCVAVITGFAERAGVSVYNSAIFTDGRQAPVVYRKSHLFGEYERSLFKPERPAAVTFDFAGLKLGMLVCYDVEFPENVRRLAMAGAEAVLVPTALPTSAHAAFIARQMIAVRAYESEVFVAYVNHSGADARFAYAGLSGIAAPDGKLLAEAGEGEALIYADIRPGDYANSPDTNSYLADLRPA